jgi:hypothetical protein
VNVLLQSKCLATAVASIAAITTSTTTATPPPPPAPPPSTTTTNYPGANTSNYVTRI